MSFCPVSRSAIGWPAETVSPTETRTALTVPAEGAGMSIVALSDSSVISGSSAATVSPAATCTSMTGTSAKSPMSGTVTSIRSYTPAGEPYPAGSPVVGRASSCTVSRPGAPAAPAAPGAPAAPSSPSACSTRIGVPSETVSPTLTSSELTVPAAGAGTSRVALSDSRVTTGSSAATVSPGAT